MLVGNISLGPPHLAHPNKYFLLSAFMFLNKHSIFQQLFKFRRAVEKCYTTLVLLQYIVNLCQEPGCRQKVEKQWMANTLKGRPLQSSF